MTTIEDLERLGIAKSDLYEKICDEMGDRVIGIWYDTARRKAQEYEVPVRDLPDYMKGYVVLRYHKYLEANNDER